MIRTLSGVFVVVLILACHSRAESPGGGAAIPSWLTPYPGVRVEVRAERPALMDTVYATSAAPDIVVKHYETVFQSAGQPFHPRFDGVGAALRVATDTCDVLLVIHPAATGSQVRTSCAAKTGGSLYGGLITGVSPSSDAEPAPKKAVSKETQDVKDAEDTPKPEPPARPARRVPKLPPPI